MIYGALIGLALVVALEAHPPAPGVMVGTLLVTALAVGLAELYSEIVGTQARTGHGIGRERLRHLLEDVAGVAFGIAFPSVFFVLAAAGALDDANAFTLAKWSGLGLIGCYGFAAARLGGAGLAASLLRALVVGAIAGALIVVKALLH